MWHFKRLFILQIRKNFFILAFDTNKNYTYRRNILQHSLQTRLPPPYSGNTFQQGSDIWLPTPILVWISSKLTNKKGPTRIPSNFRMIALTSCIGKTYHLLLEKRFASYLTDNNYIDKTLQKAFLPGINGCIEHNITLDEIISQAKTKKKTMHITFFDLEDAFGSVPHSLILHTLKRLHFPPEYNTISHRVNKERESPPLPLLP